MDSNDSNLILSAQKTSETINLTVMNTNTSLKQAVEHTAAGEADHNMAEADLTPWIDDGVDTRSRAQGNPNGALSDCPLVLDMPQEVLDIILRMLVVSDDPMRLENEGVVLQQTFHNHLQKCAFSAGEVSLWQKLFGKSDGERNHKRVVRYGDKDRIIGNLDKQVIADGVCTNPFSGVTKLIEAPSVLQYRLVCNRFNHSIPDIFWKENRFWFIDAEDMYNKLKSLHQHAGAIQRQFPQHISGHAEMIRTIRRVCIMWSPKKANLYDQVARMLPELASLQIALYHTNTLLSGDKKSNPSQIPGKNPLSKAKHIDTFCIAFNRFRHCTLLKEVQIVGTDKGKFWTVNGDESYLADVEINHTRAIGPVILANLLSVKEPFMTAEDLAEEEVKRKKRLATERLAEEQRKAEHKKAMAERAKIAAKKKRHQERLMKQFQKGEMFLVWMNPDENKYEFIQRDEAVRLCYMDFDKIQARKGVPTHWKYIGRGCTCELSMMEKRSQKARKVHQAQQNFQASHYMQANFQQGQKFGAPRQQLPNPPSLSHCKQYGQNRNQGIASQASTANGSGFAMGKPSQVGFVPIQPPLGNYNGLSIPLGSSNLGGVAQPSQMAQSNGVNVLGMVNANYSNMIPYQQVAPTNNGSGFAMGNLRIGGMVKAPRMLANNNGLNQTISSVGHAQVPPAAQVGPSHIAGSLLMGSPNQFGTAQQSQMGQVLNAGSLLIGNPNQSGMAQRPQLGKIYSDGRRRVTSVGHVGMSRRPSIDSNNNSSVHAIGNVSTSSVGPRPAMAHNDGQALNVLYGDLSTEFQLAP